MLKRTSRVIRLILRRSRPQKRARNLRKSRLRKSLTRNKRRAAFTLRLDSERHLKLRLAATMQGVSAQALVTEALDAMLSDIDDLDTLAEQLSGRLNRN